MDSQQLPGEIQINYHATQGSGNSSILGEREAKPVDTIEFEKSKFLIFVLLIFNI